MTDFVYKILENDLWSRFDSEGIFDGVPVDLADGFIHLSDGSQVAETAKRHFSGQKNLMLLALQAGKLGASLKWEPSRNGALFPHLYRPLQREDLVWAKALPLGPDGLHDFSGLLE